jgi:cytochrome c556
MNRTIFTVATVTAVVLGLGVAVAQQSARSNAAARHGDEVKVAQACVDVIEKRQGLMKKSGAAGKDASAMIKGEAPFDLAKTKAIFATFANDAGEMPNLFPDCSKTGDKTTAAPTIWEKNADFKALIAKFTADIKAGQENTKDLETFKASIDTISKDCASCHQQFRVRRS